MGNNSEAVVTRRCRADQALRFVAKCFNAKGISTMLTSIVHSRTLSKKKKIFHPEDLPSRLPAYVCVYYIYMNARDSHNRISARDVTELDGFLIRVIR